MNSFIERSGGTPGEFVRIKGQQHRVLSCTFNGKREYMRILDGWRFSLDRAEQVVMANRCELTTDASWNDVSEAYAEVLELDWVPGSFSEQEISSGYRKQLYLQALDGLDARERRKSGNIRAALAKAKEENADLAGSLPSVEAVRKWDERWLASGRDIRVLADRNHDKGAEGGKPEFAWIDEEINVAIETYMLAAPYWHVAQVVEHLEPIIARRAREESLPLRPRTGAGRYFGANRVAMLFAKRNQHDQSLRDAGRREARRRTKGISRGPSGDYPLHEAEIDHHQMDLIVLREDGTIWGRPWLTAIIDRYSRMILGFAITMEPPSWASVMWALRLGVSPKEDYLSSLNYKFEFGWNCCGSMDFLFMDRAAEFRSRHLKATASVLNIVLVDVPRARGDLKGKIERWFGVTAQGVVSKLPGYTGSRPHKRIRETAKPKLTLREAELVVAVYVVDIYNNTRHGETEEWPSKRYAKAMENGMHNKLPPPSGLLGPATSPALTCALTDRGIRFDNVRYKSDDLLALWYRTGNVRVLVRPDEKDARTVLVHDGNRKWIVANLEGKYAESEMTRHELRLQRRADKAPKETEEEREAQLRATHQFGELIDKLAPRSKARKRPVAQKRKPVTHLNKPVFDPETSGRPLEGFASGNPVALNRYDSRGNYAGPTIAEQVMDGSFDARRHARSPQSASDLHSQATEQVPASPIPPPTVDPDSQPESGDDTYETIRL